MAVVKQCTKCLRRLTFTHFYRQLRGKYGIKSICKSCENAATVQRHQAHKDIYNAQMREWRLHNEQHFKAYRKTYYRKNHNRLRAYAFARYHKNPEQSRLYNRMVWKRRGASVRIYASRRRALKHGNGGFHLNSDLNNLYEKQIGRCFWCFCVLNKYQVDHVIPLSRGGTDWPSNIVLACPYCNSSKRNKLPEEWEQWKQIVQNA